MFSCIREATYKNIHFALIRTIPWDDELHAGDMGLKVRTAGASGVPSLGFWCSLSLVLLQADHFRGCRHCHMCDFRHVLRSSQLCPLLDPGEGDESQAPAVCQWHEPHHLLADQLPLGHCECQAFPHFPGPREGLAVGRAAGKMVLWLLPLDTCLKRQVGTKPWEDHRAELIATE